MTWYQYVFHMVQGLDSHLSFLVQNAWARWAFDKANSTLMYSACLWPESTVEKKKKIGNIKRQLFNKPE